MTIWVNCGREGSIVSKIPSFPFQSVQTTQTEGGLVAKEQGQWEANTIPLHLQILLFSDMNSLIHQILER